jgi:uncharacterized protein
MTGLRYRKPNGLNMDKHSDLVTIKTIQPENDLQIIHGYGDGGFRISGNRFSGSVFVTPRHTRLWSPAAPEKLTASAIIDVAPALPPLLLLGVGAAPLSPLQTLADDLKQQGIALELMSTAAACRTWNVLISEGRNAAAALYAVA